MRILWLVLASGLLGCVTTAENSFADDRQDRPAAKPVGRLEGRVFEFRDPELMLRGAKVVIAGRTATTDPEGAFVIDGLRDGETELQVTLPGHRPSKEVITLPHPEVVRVGLHATGSINAELPTGADFKARLVLRHNGFDEAPFNGELLDGTYQVSLELEHLGGDCRWRRASEVEVDLVDGEQRKIDFKFEPPKTISGEVRDAKKKPVAGARVLASKVFEHNSLLKIATDDTTGFLEDSRCVTDGFGRFTLDGLEEGSYHLLAIAPEQPPTSLEAAAGDQDVKFVLTPEKP
jgi:hypothetical protein